MEKCFVIQPFDKGPFDKRFDDVLAPAIIKAGLEPYRVDRDPSVEIPIEDIESGIRGSRVCLAEITLDNPNVWFELGFALAVQKPVVLICSSERKSKFPFDVQHRSVIRYKTDSPSDFAELGRNIEGRIAALLKKDSEIQKASLVTPVASTQGLDQHEIVALVTVMENFGISGMGVSGYAVQKDMNKAGFTDIAISLALKTLMQKRMIRIIPESDDYGNEYNAYGVTTKGADWLLHNKDKFVLKKELPKANDDDIPF